MKNNTNSKSFAHLRARSSYSIGQSICTVKELVRKARELGMPALGLCDCGLQTAWPEFVRECRSDSAEYGGLPPIKPIIGIDLPIAWEDGGFYVRLLVRNGVGYQNLLKIISSMRKCGGWRVVDRDALRDHSEGLVLMMAGFGDEAMVDELLGTFGENLYFEVRGEEYEPAFARWPQVKRLAVRPVSFLDKEDADEFLKWKKLDPEFAPLHSEEYFKSEEEVAVAFPHHPEWIENVRELVDSIESVEVAPQLNVKTEIPSDLPRTEVGLLKAIGAEHFAYVPNIQRGQTAAWDMKRSTQVVVSYPAAIADCGIPVEKFLDGSSTYFTHFTEDVLRDMGLTLVDLDSRKIGG